MNRPGLRLVLAARALNVNQHFVPYGSTISFTRTEVNGWVWPLKRR
jgi:hypothetical protein